MKMKSIMSKALIALLSVAIATTSFSPLKASADSYTVVTLGADLTDDQKSQMLEYFGVTENDAQIIEITSSEEYEALSSVATSSQLGSKSISSSYVEPTSEGGLDISTNNLTWVTDSMIKNALITAGVENAVVKASAPFKVSGTAALTGILKGFETSSSGETIDEDKKEAANEEIVVTGDLGDSIGQDDASNLINDIKTQVIKKDPSTDEGVDKIVDKAVKDYDDQLTDEDIQSIKDLMYKINDLDLDYSSLKDQLNDVASELKDKLSSDEAQGFFSAVGNFFSNLWDSIKNLFDSNDSSTTSTESSNSSTESNNSNTTNSAANSNSDAEENSDTTNNTSESNTTSESTEDSTKEDTKESTSSTSSDTNTAEDSTSSNSTTSSETTSK